MQVSLQSVAVIIGMPRTGTTWLYEHLKQHPDICTSDYKEINRYLLDLTDQQYLDFFCDCSKPVKLDVSPFYFFDQKALARIARNHDKVILLVREEKEWIQSLNCQIRKFEKDSEEMIRTRKYALWARGTRVCFDYNTYHHTAYLSDIKRIFGNKLLVLDFSLLQREPLSLLRTIEGYLGIRPYFTTETCSFERINTSEQPMSRLYGLLIRMNILHRLIPVILMLLPKRWVHWLRRRFVYGG